MKRTPLARKASLKAQGTPLQRVTPLAATRALLTVRDMARGPSKRRPPRNTGPTAETRKLVHERAGGCCERCGTVITGDYSVHHRLPRGMGGSKAPAINLPSNLVLLCGSATTPDGCHTAVERFRQAAMTTGWIVARTADPELVPVKMISGWWFLRADGTKLPTSRPND